MEKLFDEARTEYDQARLRYTSYADSNTELILESYKAKQEDLENTMQLRYNIYSQMAQRLELAKAKVQEETPAFIGTLLWALSKEQTEESKEPVQQPSDDKDAEIQEPDAVEESE